MSITPKKKADSPSAKTQSHSPNVTANGATARAFSPEDAQRIRSALLERRESLIQKQALQLDALSSPERHHIADLEEMTSDAADADDLPTLLNLNSSNLDQIDNALEKLEHGTYGTCERCEDPIPKARLEFLPFAALCVDCQRQQEATTVLEEE